MMGASLFLGLLNRNYGCTVHHVYVNVEKAPQNKAVHSRFAKDRLDIEHC